MNLSQDLWKRTKSAGQGPGEPERIRNIVEKFWSMTLSVAALVVVLVAFYGVWKLNTVLENITLPINAVALPQPLLNHRALDTVLGALDARQQQFETLQKGGGSAIPDPSR